ncbi:MAG: thymidine kinase [Turicibacter sp.]|nr:thymidine kinase [Turicibacter sp.]
MYDFRKDGWLEAISGGMYAGKTEELIRRLKRLDFAKREYKLFKPAIDNRYSDKEVVSHSGLKMPSIPIEKPVEILSLVTENTYAVAIDEVQFFDDTVIQVLEHLADQGFRVIAAGLDKDFRGEPFGPMPILLTKAEEVTKLTSICSVCGGPATRSQRLIEGKPVSYHDPIIQVGAAEAYEPRCRHCHVVRDLPDELGLRRK